MTPERSSELGRTDLIEFGKRLVTERLEGAGCRVTQPDRRTDARLEVRSRTGRAVEVFVATQRVRGYVFWTKRRLEPASHRAAAQRNVVEARRAESRTPHPRT